MELRTLAISDSVGELPKPASLQLKGCYVPIIAFPNSANEEEISSMAVYGLGLVDTGSECCALRPDVALRLNLAVLNNGEPYIANPNNTQHVEISNEEYSQWGLSIPDLGLALRIYGSVPGFGLSNFDSECVAVIGRDVLRHCKLVYDGRSGMVMLEPAREEEGETFQTDPIFPPDSTSS